MIEWLAGARRRPRSSSPAASCPTSCARRSGEEERAGVADHATSPSREPLRHRRRDPLRRRRARRRLDDRFLALNGDVLTDLDLTALLRAHEERGARATLGLHPVEDSAAYGLVSTDAERRGARVPREDRASAVPGEINAGAYVLERSVLDLIPPGRDGLDRARGLPAAGRRRPPRRCCSTATGWTSAPRSATCRRAGTSSRGGSRPRVEPTAPGMLVAAGAEVAGDAAVGPRAVVSRRLPGRRRRRGRATRSCSTAARSARAPGSAARSSPRAPRSAPGRRSTARSSAGMKESASRWPMLDDVLAHPRPPPRRALAGRVGAAGARRGGRAAGLRHGRLGDRRRPRRGGARRPPARGRC